MPDGNDNDCENVTFYSPSDTFGGPKKLPSCLPATTRVPEELRRPTGNLDPDVPLLTPSAIRVGNKNATATCTDGSTGLAVTILPGTLTALVSFLSVPSIADNVLDYIAVNDIVPWIEEQVALLSRDEFDPGELARQTGMKLSEARSLKDALYTQVEELTDTALLAAENRLDCQWFNTPQTATCPSDLMATEEDHPDAVFSVTIPAGKVTSKISQIDADNRARVLAESSLNCFYISDAFTALCETRPDRPLDVMEPVPNDLYPVYPGLQPRIGSATVLRGQFISTSSKDDANRQAETFAYAQLRCYYVNSELFQQCSDPDARFKGEDPTKTLPVAADPASKSPGQHITVPRGFITSDLSTTDANTKAQTLASSLLECCFINKPLHVECPPYEVLDEFGNKRLDENGDPILIPASRTQSPTFSYDIPAGQYISCESQAVADEMAELAVEGVLECYYCNKIVLPTCVPDWVLLAVTSGITIGIDMTFPDGTVWHSGDVYMLTLPLDVTNLRNPYTGELEDMSTWSLDATVGAPAEFVCSPEYPQSQQLAETAGLEILDKHPDTELDNCTYQNDLIIAACAAYDPYDPDSKKLTSEGTLPNGNKYQFFSKFSPLTCLDLNLSDPKPGNYIEIPAGLITVTPAETPGTLAVNDPYYDRDYNARKAKLYANKLARSLALSMMYCVFANPYTVGYCSAEDVPAMKDLCKIDERTGKPIRHSKWTFGKLLGDNGLADGSHTRRNPLVLPKGTFISHKSIQEVYTQTRAFMLNSLQCLYCNSLQSATCGGNQEDTDDNDTPATIADDDKEDGKEEEETAAIKQLNQAVVPPCTVTADSVTEANRIAKTLAQSMLVCYQGQMVYNTQEGHADCEKQIGTTAANTAIVPVGTVSAETEEEANQLANDLAASMIACVSPAKQGPPGNDGTPGGPCGGNCYGVYS